ncbi:hypothetical protein LIANG_09205 [Enterococcus durans]|nr:hypothetical protein LIANG_09205 [Enterococcus durans]
MLFFFLRNDYDTKEEKRKRNAIVPCFTPKNERSRNLFSNFVDFDLLLKEMFLIHCFFVFRRGRDESRLGLRNWMKKGWDRSV